MLKKSLSIVLLIIFTNFIVAPTIISLVDNTADISMVFNLNEEEHKESKKDIQLKVLQTENIENTIDEFTTNNTELNEELYSNHYQKLHSPPPELS